MKDFTHTIYKEFLTSLLKNHYNILRVEDYFLTSSPEKPFIIIRHDVDRNPLRSLSMARIEAKMGIKATYYFRTIPQTFKPNIIEEIVSLGHEIGYPHMLHRQLILNASTFLLSCTLITHASQPCKRLGSTIPSYISSFFLI